MSAEVGFEDEGVSGSVTSTLSESYRHLASESTTSSMSYSFDVTYKVGCTAKPGVEGVGLW